MAAMVTSASARFRRKLKRPIKLPHTGERLHETEYLDIHAWKKVLTVGELHHPERTMRTTFPAAGALIAAFGAACEKAEADGWAEYGPPTTWRERIGGAVPKKPGAAAAEKQFEAMSAELARALAAAAGKKAAEKKAIVAALASYGDLKAQLDADRMEHAVHFFAVDGVGLTKKRKPALQRVKADDVARARWLKLLEDAAR
jgi:hypothetical protein